MENRQFLGGPLVPLRYTIREQLEKIGDPASTSYPFSARYGYHPNGTVSEAEFYNAGSPAAQKRYKYTFESTRYDALNRLKSANFWSWSGSSWTSTLAHDLANITYDAAGNLKTLRRYRQTGSLIDNLTYSYPWANNRLGSVSEAVGATSETWDAEAGSFTYDANGNLKTAPAPYSITSVTYDHRNLPMSLTRSGVTTTYRYDDAGQRIAKQVGTGNREMYVLEGAVTLGVVTVNSSGSPVSWYFNVLAGDRVVGRQPNTGNRRYYHTDLLGSTRAVVEGATVLESYDFDPWGLLMPGRTLAGPTKEGFTGKEQDAETGLDYFGARYYMPALGRWASVDPLADSLLHSSPYSYALNNPTVLFDPDGRCSRPAGVNSGQVGICIGVFIASKSIGFVGLGDNRGPVGDDPEATFRAQVQLVVDPSKGSIESEQTTPGKSSVFFKGLGRTGTVSREISPTVDDEGNTLISVSLSAQNGLSFLPGAPKETIDMTIVLIVTPNGEVGVAGGTRDGYPFARIVLLRLRGRDEAGPVHSRKRARGPRATRGTKDPQEDTQLMATIATASESLLYLGSALLLAAPFPIGAFAWYRSLRAPAEAGRDRALFPLLLASASYTFLMLALIVGDVLGGDYSTRRFATIYVNLAVVLIAVLWSIFRRHPLRPFLIGFSTLVAVAWVYLATVSSAV